MKITSDFLGTVAAMVLGATIGEWFVQREERRLDRNSPASPAGIVEVKPALPGGDCGNPSCDVPWHHPLP